MQPETRSSAYVVGCIKNIFFSNKKNLGILEDLNKQDASIEPGIMEVQSEDGLIARVLQISLTD